MKKDLLERLKKYALSAGAVAGAALTAEAQISYTDVNPDDTIAGSGNNYLLDLNNDNVDDFNIFISSSQFNTTFTSSYYSSTFYFGWSTQGIRVTAYGNNAVKNDSSYYPYALNNGVTVGAGGGGYWNQNSSQMMALHTAFSFNGSSSSGSYGNWVGATDKYLGLRLSVSGQTYYGWVRITINDFNEFVVKDYAYRTNANVSIVTGDTFWAPLQCMPATNLVATDVGNNQNAGDFRVAFDHATNETGIQQYRIMVVKDTNAANFDLDSAQAVTFPNYITAVTSGTSYSGNLFFNQTDVDGDPIVEDVPYRFFVMSKADGTNAQIDTLSASSNVLTLTHPIIPPPPAADTVQAVTLADISNYMDGRDLRASFNMVTDESTIGEYRIIIVKSGNAAGFTLAQAQALPTGRYTTRVPDGTNVVKQLFSITKDTDGDLITHSVPYKAFVMSLADGTNAVTSSLSPMSNEVTLNDATGITDINRSDKFKLLQNQDQLTITSLTGQNIEKLVLYNINGQMVKVVSGNSSSLTMDCFEFNTGVYFLEAQGSESAIVTKVLIP